MAVGQEARASGPVRFGAFEADLRAGELRKNGLKVRLPGQPFEVLAMMLERPGEVVTRGELQKRIWPDGTFVDFDHSLNNAINKIREALGDSAESPRFVETLARRGYRFVAPVERLDIPGTAVSPDPIERSCLNSEFTSLGHATGSNVSEMSKTGSPPQNRLRHAVLTLSVLAILIPAALIYRSARPHRPAHQVVESIAILPFENASSNLDTEYLSDGITEGLINHFSGLPRLRVVPRSSVFRYKGQRADPIAAGRQLKAQAIVTGRVIQRGDGLNVQVDLVDVSKGSQMWGEQYDRKLSDILVVQQEIVSQIADNLHLGLTGPEGRHLTKRHSQNTEAYQLYLKGRYYWSKRNSEGLKKGIEFFRAAVEQDPNYALAYAGLADSYNALHGHGLARAKDCFPLAKEAATRALAIDETLAEAHGALGFALWQYDWNWAAAEREFKLSLKLNPNYAFGHHWYSTYLLSSARHEEAIVEMTRAVELDPVSLPLNAGLTWVLCFAGQHDAAVESGLSTVGLDPTHPLGHVRLGQAYEQKLMFEEAIREFQKAAALTEPASPWLGALGHAYAVSGRKTEALGSLSQLKEQSEILTHYPIALIYVGLRETDQAFAWLEKAYEERSIFMVWLRVDPRLKYLRSDPRLIDLVKRVGK